MLTRILFFIILLFQFNAVRAQSKNSFTDLTFVKNYFQSLDNVLIDFRQCNKTIQQKESCQSGKMYLTRNFNNKYKTRMRIDYVNPKISIIVDKDTIMYCDHELEETSYFSEDVLLFRLLNNTEINLDKYFISDYSSDKNFIFRQALSNGDEAIITLAFNNMKKLQQITVEEENNTYIIDEIVISPHDDQAKFSMRNPFSARKKKP